jgi:hypothetical protein
MNTILAISVYYLFSSLIPSRSKCYLYVPIYGYFYRKLPYLYAVCMKWYCPEKPIFRRNISPLYSGSKSRTRTEVARSRQNFAGGHVILCNILLSPNYTALQPRGSYAHYLPKRILD